MIAISTESGDFLKAVPWSDGKCVGYNRLLGFTSDQTAAARLRNRQRHGFRSGRSQFDFKFRFSGKSEMDFVVDSVAGCEVALAGDSWLIKDQGRTFKISVLKQAPPIAAKSEKTDLSIWFALLIAASLPGLFFLLPQNHQDAAAPVVLDQVVVQIKPEVQKSVAVTTALDRLPEVKKQAPTAKRAINQNLGFLGLLGRKDLKKALGSVPQLREVSAGAGQGKEGSGGELLVGIGQGLKRTTVGNTGVAGLGGIGTRGAGGGAGGYGNSAIGSGDGKALSSIPLSQDLVLEGGLDRSVVQATIAKYLSQVRACYEAGLQRNPGLAGEVTMRFEIGGGGDLNFAKVERTSLDDKGVESCISGRMMGWKFPKPRGGVNVKVSYPFVLRSTQA